MKYYSILVMSFCLITLNANAEVSRCRAPVTELQSGVHEVNLETVKIKTEEYNHIAKMKLIGAVNEDWNSVPTDQGPAAIAGYIGNGESAVLRSEIVVKESEDKQSLQYAILKVQESNPNKGTAYFISSLGVRCLEVSLDEWTHARDEAFGEITVRSSINLERDGID